MNRHALERMLGGLLLTTTTMGCALGSSPELNPDTAVKEAGDVFVLMETEEYEGDVGGMGLSGRLTLLPGNCVGFRKPKRLIVFPPGTKVTQDGGEVVIHVEGDDLNKPSTLHIGDEVEAGTRASGSGDPLQDFGGNLADEVPQECQDFPAIPVDGFKVTTPRRH